MTVVDYRYCIDLEYERREQADVNMVPTSLLSQFLIDISRGIHRPYTF